MRNPGAGVLLDPKSVQRPGRCCWTLQPSAPGLLEFKGVALTGWAVLTVKGPLSLPRGLGLSSDSQNPSWDMLRVPSPSRCSGRPCSLPPPGPDSVSPQPLHSRDPCPSACCPLTCFFPCRPGRPRALWVLSPGCLQVGHSFCTGFNLPRSHGGQGEGGRPQLALRVISRSPSRLMPAVPEVLMAVSSLGECPPVGGCNEKRMLAMLPHCGQTFAERMKKVEVWKWCNLSEFIV